jgi:hypothetical protein
MHIAVTVAHLRVQAHYLCNGPIGRRFRRSTCRNPVSKAHLAAQHCISRRTHACCTGSLSPEFEAWTRLAYLDLSATSLSAPQRVSGNLSKQFSAWTDLELFAADNTNLSGELFAVFSSWLELRWLSLANTKLSGTLHVAFQLWTQLNRLDLSSTGLSGTIDGGFSFWSAIDTISLVCSREGSPPKKNMSHGETYRRTHWYRVNSHH